jgi:hypothetical protein
MEPGIPEQKIAGKTSRMARHVSRNIYGRSFSWGQERGLLVLFGRTV